MADWLLALLDAAGVQQAAAGRPQHGLADRAGSRAPRAGARQRAWRMLGTTYPMKVSDALLAARSDDEPAIDMVNIWSHSSIAHKPSCPGPGFSTMGGARRLMQRISQHQSAAAVPHRLLGLQRLCQWRRGGAQAVRCPTLFLFGARDMMTPPRSTRLLTSAISMAES
jgi:pimeloyl-ACP methyl ester carboxylesterase